VKECGDSLLSKHRSFNYVSDRLFENRRNVRGVCLVLRPVTNGSNISKVVDQVLDMEKSHTFSSQ
jgi:hypothetical protein